MPIIGFIAAAIQKAFAAFSDTFNRTTSGSLGTSSSGGLWRAIRGTIYANGSAATTTDAVSSYPIAAVKMSTGSVTANISGTANGTGHALWVTDSGNWWAVVTGQDPGVSCNCQTCSQCNAWNTPTCTASTCTGGYNTVCTAYNTSNCASFNSANCNSWNGSNCRGYNGGNCKSWCGSTCCGGYYYGTCIGYNTSTCNSWNTATCASWNGSNCSTYGTGNCNAWFCTSYTASCTSTSYYSCNCSTCYPPIVRVLQSVSNTVSEVTKWTLASVANSLRVITNSSAKTITTKAFSDAAQVTQIGSDLVYTANNAAIVTDFGIIVAPSSYAQGTTIDGYDATAN